WSPWSRETISSNSSTASFLVHRIYFARSCGHQDAVLLDESRGSVRVRFRADPAAPSGSSPALLRHGRSRTLQGYEFLPPVHQRLSVHYREAVRKPGYRGDDQDADLVGYIFDRDVLGSFRTAPDCTVSDAVARRRRRSSTAAVAAHAVDF